MTRCRVGWYQDGRVTRHVYGRPRAEVPADEASAPARLRTAPNGAIGVEALMSGATWFGRLAPKKSGQNAGIVLLYERSGVPGE